MKNKSKYLSIAFGLLILFLCWCRFCQPVKKLSYPKPDISKEVKKQDSTEKEVKKTDSVRTVYVIKWKRLKTNPDTLPCDSFVTHVIHFCDTIIQIDSTEISSLKSLHSVDSTIIGKQNEGLKNDSIKIAKLDRKVRFWKFMTKAAFVTGIAGGGYTGLRLAK